jgi:hypothetical protein
MICGTLYFKNSDSIRYRWVLFELFLMYR